MRRQKAKGKRQKEASSIGLRRRGRALFLAFFTFAFCLLPFAFGQRETEESPELRAAFHRWGAVTIFHGLPSDRVRAVAQDAEGLMWFGTDGGLARYDGRRIQTITDLGLSSARVLALRTDSDGALWVGTDGGAFVRTPAGEFRRVEGTAGKVVGALTTNAPGRAVVATSDGLIFDCQRGPDGTYTAEPRGERLTSTQAGTNSQGPQGTQGAQGQQSSTARTPQPLELTSLAAVGETLLVGTRGRGLLAVERGGSVRELTARPRAYFVEAVEADAAGHVHLGAQAPGGDSGLLRLDGADSSALRTSKVAGVETGTVNALRADARGDLYVGTDARGVFRLREGRRVERFTFAGTAGALRSDRVYSVFIDREGVAWFGTDRGVCRYDPRGLRVEAVSEERESNFVRALYRSQAGALYAGTNRGLFVRDAPGAAWRFVEALGRRPVYAVAEDRRGRILVGTVAGLYASLPPAGKTGANAPAAVRFVPEPTKVKDAEKVEPALDSKPVGETDDAAPQPEPDAATKTEGPPPASAAEAKPEAEKAEQSAPTAAPVVAGNVRAVATFGGNVYIATFGRGVERLDEEFRRTAVWPRPGGGGGEDESRLREPVSLHAEESAGRLWVGTASGGLLYLDAQGANSDPAHASLARATVYGVSRSPDGWLWLATARGLYAQRPTGELLEVVPQVDARAVVALGARDAADGGDAEGSSFVARAWCATAGGGVLRVSVDEQFGHVSAALDAEQGLPSQNAFALLPLAAEEPGGEGVLLVGTSRGLALYEPGTTAPVVRPTRLVAARPLPLEELQAGRPVVLEYPQNGLVLDVAAVSSRTFPEQFQYAFSLRDEGGAVIKRKLSHDSQFQVESLKPGRYKVTARAFTIDLTPSSPLTFEFVVSKAPFPWTTAALSVLLALALAALVGGYVQHRKIVRAGSELMEANRQLAAARLQLANEAESERRRIARDLHDQTLADLRRLMLLADEMQAGGGGNGGGNGGAPAVAGAGALAGRTPSLDPATLRAEIESVSQEIRRICEDLSPSVLENVGFAAALEWALAERVAHMPPDCKFTYEFECEDGLEERLHFAPGVQMQVYRIVQEAVSNVCRHAAATRVRLTVGTEEDGSFLLKLEDDGRGLPPENRKARRGRGLSNIRARASLIEAEVEWRKRDGGGTTFVLRKPVKG